MKRQLINAMTSDFACGTYATILGACFLFGAAPIAPAKAFLGIEIGAGSKQKEVRIDFECNGKKSAFFAAADRDKQGLMLTKLSGNGTLEVENHYAIISCGGTVFFNYDGKTGTLNRAVTVPIANMKDGTVTNQQGWLSEQKNAVLKSE